MTMSEMKMTTLEAWLSSATRGLSAESAAQVRAEIQEHFQSAYEAALADGAPCQEADLAALAALGDAGAANRQYRRVLLTSQEDETLRLMDGRQSSLPPRRVAMGKWLARILAAEGFLGVAYFTWKDHAWLWFWLTQAAVFTAFRFLPINSPSRGRTYRCVKWVAMIGATALAARFGSMPLSVLLAPLFVLAYSEYVHASMRRKLPAGQCPKRLYR
jgi:hypothetical protein